MATSTAIPVTIEPEAEAHLAALGLEGPYQEILDRGKRVVPSLRKVEVLYGFKHDDPDNPTIVVEFIADPSLDPIPIRKSLDHWFLDAYHPDVLRHFLIRVLPDLP